jgi:hypothetical protein
LDSLLKSQLDFLAQPEKHAEASNEKAQERLKDIRESLPGIAQALRAHETQLMAHAQGRRFRAAMEQAYEILGAAIIFIDQ